MPLTWFGMLVFFTDSSLNEFLVTFLVLQRYSMLRFPVDRKSSNEWFMNDGVPQITIPGTSLFLMYINYLSDDKIICNIASYTNDTTLDVNLMELLALTCSKCHLILLLNCNPFVPNAPFLCPLKTSKTIRFSDIFRGKRKDALGTNGLI